ncbi:MAG TPA: TonB-dependent receptor, partial [Chryseosolibacter sp.]|nr:TonB-dependent receptor [Chryseosolibacter sp.]
FYQGSFASVVLVFLCSSVYAQSVVSGRVIDAANSEPLAGVNIIVKGKVVGTVSDAEGKFTLTVKDPPPFTLIFSFVGYRSIESPITDANTANLEVKLEEQWTLGEEIVVSASRVEESILESPVSIEKMDILEVKTTPSESYYKGLANLKGVDVTASSINFQILNARGFGSTGNTRFVQLIDGMDTQAPALNFPIGNLNGPSELDVESVELIPGASSALYGPNAFNGIVLINSKNPFEYQGISAMAKLGVNHVGKDADFDGPSPVYDAAFRAAKVFFNNRFAVKLNLSYMRAEDWHGSDTYDKESGRTPLGTNGAPLFNLGEGASSATNPGSDKLHFMGDEASINMAIFPFSSGWRTFASTSSTYYNNIFEPGLTALTYAQAGDLPSHVVSVTPYREEDLIDYGAENMKGNLGLYYRLTDKLELSGLYNGGFGTSVYTGAQRYSLSNFKIQQGRLQLRGDNFFIRAYGTFENSGDSYITEFLAKRVNDLAVNQANPLFSDVSGFLATYATEYLRHLYNQGLDPGEINGLPADQRTSIQQGAHIFARSVVDAKYHLDPNSANFRSIKERAMNGTVPQGPRFNDKTNLFHGEFQYDFKNEIDVVELQVGSSFRMFDLNSNGTIFDDKDENITIKEYGAYLQAGKWLADRKIKLSGSVRYDKNENFKGRVNPRVSAVFKVVETHNIRLSYQTGFRIPSTQGQHIDLNVLSSRLLGGLQRYADKYDIVRTSSTGEYLSFEGTSVQRYRQEAFATGNIPQATQQLVEFTNFNPVKPEQVRAIEIGYKSVLQNNFLIDVAYYFNLYNNFITQVQVVTAEPDGGGNPNYLTILNSNANNTFSIYTNAPGEVTAQGAVVGLTYNFLKGYTASGNYNWNRLGDVPEGFIAEFNTPEHKVNFTFGNRNLTDELGFNVTWRWQTAFDWQSSFTNYTLYPVPAYNTIDAQLSYKLPTWKSTFKLGGSNILNKKYIMSGGGPNIGGLYYISIVFDEMFR